MTFESQQDVPGSHGRSPGDVEIAPFALPALKVYLPTST